MKDLFNMSFNFIGSGFNYLNQYKSTSLTIAMYLGFASLAVYSSKYSVKPLKRFS